MGASDAYRSSRVCAMETRGHTPSVGNAAVAEAVEGRAAAWALPTAAPLTISPQKVTLRKASPAITDRQESWQERAGVAVMGHE